MSCDFGDNEWVNTIIQQAINDKASDIHIEPDEEIIRVRYRIDGILNELMKAPKTIQSELLSRLKIMAQMDISEKRLPQDGRIKVKVQNKSIDLRVSSLPTVFGEKIVIRILDKSRMSLTLDQVGFDEDLLKLFKTLSSAPNGIVLMTGPTGSGKTSTLYAAINFVKSPQINITTVEDPVEYTMAGVNQTQVNTKANMTFAAALRSILRQDPDVIMIGEIRDEETAGIAVEAALTGHLVFATLHTNDAPSTAIRLVDMGVEPFLVSSALLCIVSQRLARRVCKFCKDVDTTITPETIADLDLPPEAINQTYYRGKGCEKCGKSGYKGRVGVHEVMYTHENLRRMIIQKVGPDDLRAEALKLGMKSLKEDIVVKFQQGLTTPEEVFALARAD